MEYLKLLGIAVLIASVASVVTPSAASANDDRIIIGDLDAAQAQVLESSKSGQDSPGANDPQVAFIDAVNVAQQKYGRYYSSAEWDPSRLDSEGYLGWISFTSDAPRSVSRQVRAAGIPIEIRFDAAASERKLENVRNEAMAEVYASGDFDGLTGDIDPESGAITIRYDVAENASSNSTPGKLKALRSEVRDAATSVDSPVDVEVKEANNLKPVQEVVRGGALISGCTLGFAAMRGSVRGAVTAGHCPNTAGKPTGSSVALRYVAQRIGTNGDVQFHSTSDSLSNRIRISSAGTLRTITARGSSVRGIAMCNYGRTRNGPSCTSVRNANHAFYANGVLLTGMAQSNGSFTNAGDSGGPWYYGSVAAGIHFGKSGGYSTYTKIFNAEIALGFRTKTS